MADEVTFEGDRRRSEDPLDGANTDFRPRLSEEDHSQVRRHVAPRALVAALNHAQATAGELDGEENSK